MPSGKYLRKFSASLATVRLLAEEGQVDVEEEAVLEEGEETDETDEREESRMAAMWRQEETDADADAEEEEEEEEEEEDDDDEASEEEVGSSSSRLYLGQLDTAKFF